MISFDRYNIAVMVEAGFIYLGMQHFPEAKKVFEGVVTLAPDDDIPLVALGNAEFCQGNFKKAQRHYEEALELNPKSIFAKVYMGEALFFEGKRDEAIEVLKAVKTKDAKGAAGGFATVLLNAIHDGFVPKMIKNSEKKVPHATKKKVSKR